MTLFLVELRTQTMEPLSVLGLLVAFSGGPFSDPFLMVESGKVSIDPSRITSQFSYTACHAVFEIAQCT